MPVVTITIKHYNALDAGFTVCICVVCVSLLSLSMKCVCCHERRRMKRIISGNSQMTHHEAKLSHFNLIFFSMR